MAFMEEWIRIVSFPVSPIYCNCCFRFSFVYMIFSLLSRLRHETVKDKDIEMLSRFI